jgi:hypothetical protein
MSENILIRIWPGLKPLPPRLAWRGGENTTIFALWIMRKIWFSDIGVHVFRRHSSADGDGDPGSGLLYPHHEGKFINLNEYISLVFTFWSAIICIIKL